MRVEDIEDGVCPISLGFVKLPTNLFSARGREHRDLLPDCQSDDDDDEEEDDDYGDNEVNWSGPRKDLGFHRPADACSKHHVNVPIQVIMQNYHRHHHH